MPEADTKDEKNFFEDVPARTEGFFLKGSESYDWGMTNRLARIFRPESGRTVMLAIDHGYFQGPTTGLERIDLSIVPLAPYADALMLTRGTLRSMIPATHRGGIVMSASGGPSILKELSDEQIAVGMEDAARMNVNGVAVQVFVGGEYETQSIENMTTLVDAGYRVRHPGARRHRRRQGTDTRLALPGPRDADLRRAGRTDREDLLLSTKDSSRSPPAARSRS